MERKREGVNLNKIKGLRVENGWTQKQLAEKLGICDRTYYCKENGFNKFTIDELLKLSELFDVKLKDLFF